MPKINQNGLTNDWRYFQGITVSYSPKWVSGLSIGFIRWVQMYSALVRGKYYWMNGKPSYFPLFWILFLCPLGPGHIILMIPETH